VSLLLRLSTRALLPAFAAPVVLAACGSGATEPPALTGRYTLRTDGGVPLPVPYIPALAGPTPTLDGGVLEVSGPDTLRVTLVIGGSQRQFAFGYQRIGDSLVVARPAGAGGRVAGGTVRVRLGFPTPPSYGVFTLTWHDLGFQQ